MARSSLFGRPASLAFQRADSRRSPGREKVRRLLPLSTLLRDARDLLAERKGRLAVGLTLLLVNRVARLVFPGTVKFLMDEVIGEGRRELLPVLLLAAGGATIVQAVTSFGLTQALGQAAQRSITRMRRRIQRHVGRLSVTYFDQTKAGTLTSRVMSDAEGIRNLVGTGFIETVGGLISAALILAILFQLNARLTLVAVGVLSLFGLVLAWAFRTLRPLFRERSEIQAEVSGRLTESFAGVRVIKAYRAERREALVFSRGVHRLLRNVSKTMTGFSAVTALTTVLLGLAAIVVLWIGTEDVLADRMTIGSLLSFLLYLGLLAGPVFQVVSIGGQISESLAGIERLREIFDEPVEQDGETGRKPVGRLKGWVEFRDVSFAYVTGLPVLRGVSFTAHPGTVTALVGSSGAGKSTLIGMVAAFYRPTDGAILVDGNDLAAVRLSDYRTQLGVVLQDNFLFDGTIFDNIAFAWPDASEAQVRRAAAVARCDEFVRRFPDGYATVVGERGVRCPEDSASASRSRARSWPTPGS